MLITKSCGAPNSRSRMAPSRFGDGCSKPERSFDSSIRVPECSRVVSVSMGRSTASASSAASSSSARSSSNRLLRNGRYYESICEEEAREFADALPSTDDPTHCCIRTVADAPIIGDLQKCSLEVIGRHAYAIVGNDDRLLGQGYWKAYVHLDRKSTRLNSSHIPLSRI